VRDDESTHVAFPPPAPFTPARTSRPVLGCNAANPLHRTAARCNARERIDYRISTG
jgi:hypothetical protein